jgi:hypothetical protein
MPSSKRKAPDAAPAAKVSAASSRLRLALGNAWNLAALAACGGLAFLTRNPVPLLAGAALEAGWLALATRPRASALIFASHHAEAARVSARAHRAAVVASLPESDADRVRRLEERQADIVRRCEDNKHLAREVLLAEVARLADVIDSFFELASHAHRTEAYLAAVDTDDLDSETARAETEAARAVDPVQRRVAAQQLDVLLRRRGQLDELRQELVRTRAQLELIESTLALLAHEIMLRRSTDELRGPLDDLVVGVRAVREAAGDAGDPLLSATENETEPDDRASRGTHVPATVATVRRG